MRVSALVPTRNRPALLEQSLAAISRQTRRPDELIVVDDGSDAASASRNEALVRAMGPGATRVFLQGHDPKGSGPSYVRNVAIGAATGELIAFCDDDDAWCDDRHLEVAERAFAEDSELDLFFANQQGRRGGKVEIDVWMPRVVERLPAARMADSRVRLEKRDCLVEDHAHLNTCVFRRELLERIGGFWEGVRYQEDLDLYVRAVDAARRVEYRDATVSIHNIPDRSQRSNASTLLDAQAKRFTEVTVANHLVQTCRSPEARRYAERIAGWAYRHLAMDAEKARDDAAAFLFARLALAWLPTTKWRAYSAFLGCKAFLAPAAARG